MADIAKIEDKHEHLEALTRLRHRRNITPGKMGLTDLRDSCCVTIVLACR